MIMLLVKRWERPGNDEKKCGMEKDSKDFYLYITTEIL